MSLILTVCVLLHTGSDAIYRRGFRGWAQGLKVGIRGVLWRHTNTLIMRSNSLLLRKPLLSQLKWNCFSLICYFLGDRVLQKLINNMNSGVILLLKWEVRSMSSTSHILGIADEIIVSLNEILNLLPDYHSTGYMFLHHGITKITLTWAMRTLLLELTSPSPTPF